MMNKRLARSAALTAPALAAGLAAVLALAVTTFAGSAQRTFGSAEEAASTLIQATRADNVAELRTILGPESAKLLDSGDRYADRAARQHFLAAYGAKHALVPEGDGRVILDVGEDGWPLPIPIVRSGERWHFDSRQGAEEIVNRRIGRNEIAAIRVALAYVDAQKDYFARSRQQGGQPAYAERLVSSPGRRDGLYWPAASGEPESPFGPLVVAAQEEGYPGELVSGRQLPYQGYYFRILKAQGPDAPGGAKKYVLGGRMTGGFALIAWPANYGSSGIMTFMANQDGVVFQKDLGPETARLAAATTTFEPDLSWATVDIANH